MVNSPTSRLRLSMVVLKNLLIFTHLRPRSPTSSLLLLVVVLLYSSPSPLSLMLKILNTSLLMNVIVYWIAIRWDLMFKISSTNSLERNKLWCSVVPCLMKAKRLAVSSCKIKLKSSSKITLSLSCTVWNNITLRSKKSKRFLSYVNSLIKSVTTKSLSSLTSKIELNIFLSLLLKRDMLMLLFIVILNNKNVPEFIPNSRKVRIESWLPPIWLVEVLILKELT